MFLIINFGGFTPKLTHKLRRFLICQWNFDGSLPKKKKTQQKQNGLSIKYLSIEWEYPIERGTHVKT